jgi:hypothetical protein
MTEQQFYDAVRKIVYQILTKEKLLQSEWHLGTVESVIDSKTLSVYVDGSTTPQAIPCNPDVTFNVGDEVFVLFVNNDSRNKFVPFKRGV